MPDNNLLMENLNLAIEKLQDRYNTLIDLANHYDKENKHSESDQAFMQAREIKWAVDLIAISIMMSNTTDEF